MEAEKQKELEKKRNNGGIQKENRVRRERKYMSDNIPVFGDLHALSHSRTLVRDTTTVMSSRCVPSNLSAKPFLFSIRVLIFNCYGWKTWSVNGTESKVSVTERKKISPFPCLFFFSFQLHKFLQTDRSLFELMAR